MTSVEANLSATHPYTGTEQIMVANAQNLSISGIGSIDIATPQQQHLTLSNVYFVPNLSLICFQLASWLITDIQFILPLLVVSYRIGTMGR